MSRITRGGAALGAAALAVVASGLVAPRADAAPYSAGDYVKTVHCNVADPYPGPRIPVPVDVYTGMTFPSDGLPGPAISLRANDPRPGGQWGNVFEYTISTTVNWKNLRTGRSGRGGRADAIDALPVGGGGPSGRWTGAPDDQTEGRCARLEPDGEPAVPDMQHHGGEQVAPQSSDHDCGVGPRTPA
ncbi:hypothetical protein ACFOJ6_03035 [Gordonia humi]|uniref:hypothetical protein n=1 Tax=Gordonia humi TaxID=686429 RepID=UPI0036153529